MMQIRENGEKQLHVEASGQSTIGKQRGWKEKVFQMIDWRFANGKWRNQNGKYSNSYGGT